MRPVHDARCRNRTTRSNSETISPGLACSRCRNQVVRPALCDANTLQAPKDGLLVDWNGTALLTSVEIGNLTDES